jgi:hypothetical protein
MRTTIRLDDGLLIELKTRAATSGRTLGEVIEDVVRAGLARQAGGGLHDRPDLPTFAGGRPLPGVDLDDSAALLDVMETRH